MSVFIIMAGLDPAIHPKKKSSLMNGQITGD